MKIYGKIELGISMVYEIVEFKEKREIAKIPIKLLDDFTKLVKEENFKVIEVVTIPPFDAKVLRKIKDEIKKRISPFKTIYHLPFGEINISAIHDGIRKTSVTEIKSLIDLAADLEIEKVVLHPGSSTTGSLPSIVSLMRRSAIESIFEIQDQTKEKGMSLALENLDYNEVFFKKPEEFKIFVKKGIGICLDTVHAMRSGVNPLDFLKMFGEKIVEIHLTDGVEGTVEHSAIGSGKVNCLEVIKEYTKNRQGLVILEVTHKKDIKESLEFLKKNKVIE